MWLVCKQQLVNQYSRFISSFRTILLGQSFLTKKSSLTFQQFHCDHQKYIFSPKMMCFSPRTKPMNGIGTIDIEKSDAIKLLKRGIKFYSTFPLKSIIFINKLSVINKKIKELKKWTWRIFLRTSWMKHSVQNTTTGRGQKIDENFPNNQKKKLFGISQFNVEKTRIELRIVVRHKIKSWLISWILRRNSTSVCRSTKRWLSSRYEKWDKRHQQQEQWQTMKIRDINVLFIQVTDVFVFQRRWPDEFVVFREMSMKYKNVCLVIWRHLSAIFCRWMIVLFSFFNKEVVDWWKRDESSSSIVCTWDHFSCSSIVFWFTSDCQNKKILFFSTNWNSKKKQRKN